VLEFLARIKALLRRHERHSKKMETVQFEDVRVDFKRMESSRGGKKLSLTPKEYELLKLLIRRRGEVVTREDFLKEIWEADADVSTRTVDNQIVSLRQKLGKPKNSASFIVTIHGAGYKFIG